MADDDTDSQVAQAPELDDPDKRLLKLKRWHKDSIGGVEDWRRKAETDYAFRAGHQWEDSDRKKLEDEQRPVITFNRCGPIIDVTSGLEINGREQIGLKPREKSDTASAEVGMSLVEYVRDACDAEDEETDAFEDLLIAGMGWSEAYIDPDTGEIKQRRIDPFEMVWPRGCKQKNLGDAKYLIRVREVDREEAEAMWPDADKGDLDARWAKTSIDVGRESPAFSDPTYDRGDQLKGGESDKVTIVECQWREVMPRVKVTRWEQDPNTGEQRVAEKATLDPERAQAIAEQAAQAMPPIRLEMQSVREVVIWQGFYGNKELQYEQLPVQGEGFLWKAMTGKWDREDETFYGLLRMAHDPQRYANKWLSQSLHILNTTAKNTVVYDPAAFSDSRKFENSWAQPGSTIAIADNGNLDMAYRVVESQTFPQGFFQLMQFAIDSIREVTGVNLELAGMQDNEQAGVLEYQRKQSAMTVLAPFFGSLRRMRKGIGRVLLRLIIEYMPEDEMLRVVGEKAGDQDMTPEEQRMAVSALKTKGFDKYDVVVDEAPTSPHAKERAWAAIQQMLPLLQSFGESVPPEIWVEIARYSPLPGAMSEKIAAAIMQKSDPAEDAKRAEEEEIMKQSAIAKMERDKAAAHKDEAQAQKTTAEASRPPPDAGPDVDPQTQQALAYSKMQRDQAATQKDQAHAEHIREQTRLEPFKVAGQSSNGNPQAEQALAYAKLQREQAAMRKDDAHAQQLRMKTRLEPFKAAAQVLKPQPPPRFGNGPTRRQ